MQSDIRTIKPPFRKGTKNIKGGLSALSFDWPSTETQMYAHTNKPPGLPESCPSKTKGPRGRRPGVSALTHSLNRPGDVTAAVGKRAL